MPEALLLLFLLTSFSSSWFIHSIYSSAMLEGTCTPHHDWFTALLTFGLCCGLIISYLPQHFRIIHAGTSEGFSPLFLLLGSTSSAAGMFNMITMQWGIVRCCSVVSLGSCIEMTAGVVQVGLQWFLFTVVFVLYMFYYPEHLKTAPPPLALATHTGPIKVSPLKSEEWKASIVLAWITAVHWFALAFTTIYLLGKASASPSPAHPLPHSVAAWATFLGVSSAMLAAIQYAPQLVHTYRMKLVGALSIPMMCIQSPGAVFMVLSIALRPGTNWTSWITFAVSGIMQGSLLTMYIIWKLRQRRLGVDDFGNPLFLPPSTPAAFEEGPYAGAPEPYVEEDEDEFPGLEDVGENRAAVRVALARALESAVGADFRAGIGGVPERHGEDDVQEEDVRREGAGAPGSAALDAPSEETPLLGSRASEESKSTWERWFGWN